MTLLSKDQLDAIQTDHHDYDWNRGGRDIARLLAHVEAQGAEIARLRAPVEDAEVEKIVKLLRREHSAENFVYGKSSIFAEAADLITRLVRGRDRYLTLGYGSDQSLRAKYQARAEAAEAETERVRKGGCARDQTTTQWCAEAVQALARAEAAEAEVVRLRNNLMCAHGNGCKCIDCAHSRAALEKKP